MRRRYNLADAWWLDIILSSVLVTLILLIVYDKPDRVVDWHYNKNRTVLTLLYKHGGDHLPNRYTFYCDKDRDLTVERIPFDYRWENGCHLKININDHWVKLD